MKLTYLATATLIAATLQAQRYSPQPQFETFEGGGSVNFLGSTEAMRYQYADRTQIGSSMQIKGVAFRLDPEQHPSARQPQWADVTVSVSACNYGALSKFFAQNPTQPPTVVRTGPVSWPLAPVPNSIPSSAWARLDYQTPYVYAGNEALLTDMTYSGGTFSSTIYNLDTPTLGTVADGPNVTLGTRCQGSISSFVQTDSRSNSVIVRATGFGFGISTPVWTALGLRANPLGQTIPGFACNKLYVDLSAPFVLKPSLSDTSARILVHFGGPNGISTYQPSLAGINVVMQSVFSTGGATRLSTAVWSAIPRPPFGPRNSDMGIAGIAVRSATSTAGAIYRNGIELPPVIRYAE